MIVGFHGLKFDLPEGWTDITDDLPDGSPPSLARTHGAGSIQFSFAVYRSGERPEVKMPDLRFLLADFFNKNQLSPNSIHEHIASSVFYVNGISRSGGEFISARYASNGSDILLATYVCQSPENAEMENDLKGFDSIMESLEF